MIPTNLFQFLAFDKIGTQLLHCITLRININTVAQVSIDRKVVEDNKNSVKQVHQKENNE